MPLRFAPLQAAFSFDATILPIFHSASTAAAASPSPLLFSPFLHWFSVELRLSDIFFSPPFSPKITPGCFLHILLRRR